jgi:hypothetical protein
MKKTLANFLRLVGRSIQGIGGGGILTLGEIIVTDMVPLAVRGGAFLCLFSEVHSLTAYNSLVRLPWEHVGNWLRGRPVDGRCLCTKGLMAVDFLDKSTNNWDWCHRYHILPDARPSSRQSRG